MLVPAVIFAMNKVYSKCPQISSYAYTYLPVCGQVKEAVREIHLPVDNYNISLSTNPTQFKDLMY